MPFAKDFFDVGLFTNKADAVRAYYSELGLPFDHTLKLGGGVLQHRYQADQAVLKINDARTPLPPRIENSPLIELIIACANCTVPSTGADPDGTIVSIVPPGHRGIQGLAVRLSVASPEISQKFYKEALGLTDVSPGVMACGRSLLLLEETSKPSQPDAPLAALGLRYLTLQVFDCDASYARALQAGAISGRAPETLGNTARIAFILDPDGTWIEISERASVTGKKV
ncbi:VOC family protein [uncultured Halopseudomonas sp.]|mgnify:CR=1 FL=1|uniref:VOC family protein n=1 Tax=uncultured Halopseudomonas sp. TaxID=2901193 RepID=UPI0030EE4F3C